MSRSSLLPRDVAAIAAGGVLGATVRWSITRSQVQVDWFGYTPNTSGAVLSPEPAIPGATLLVNLIGCALLGGLTLLLIRPMATSQRRVLVAAATGFCGSLTTFSAFAVEVAHLLRGAERSTGTPSWAFGVAYVAVSVAGGALAFWLGRIVVQQIATPSWDVGRRSGA